MCHGTCVVFLALVALAAIPESTGNCIKKYGHSCLGGHGKRTQLPILSKYAIMSESAQPSSIHQKYPHSRIASMNRIPVSMHRGNSEQAYKNGVGFPELQISPGEIGNGFAGNRGLGNAFFAGNGLNDIKESISADETIANQGYTNEELTKNLLLEKILFSLENHRRQPYSTAKKEVDAY